MDTTDAVTKPFVHLHVHTEYSLLDGASRITKLIAKAKELGMPAIAITDHGVMYGAVDFYKEAKRQGIKPIIGCEVYIAPNSRFDKKAIEGEAYYHLVLLAETQIGYHNLLKLVSRAHLEGFYYRPRIDWDLLSQFHEGLICLSACMAGEIPQRILKGDFSGAEQLCQKYVAVFGRDHFFLELQDHGLPEQRQVNAGLVELARRMAIKVVATNDVHYVNREDASFHEVLLCIQTGKTLDDPNRMRFSTEEFYLKDRGEMAKAVTAADALTNTLMIAERCNVELEFGKLHLPDFPVPAGTSDIEYLQCLCQSKVAERYKVVTAAVSERLEFELGVIKAMGYASYFLIVWDLVEFARKQNIAVGPGRGSAAGSIVAYVLGITQIDPLQYDLLFERFLNPERVSMPDIDIDFCYVNRSRVIEYVVKRYGQDRVSQIITFGTMAAKAAIRDVGRVLGLAYNDVDRIAKLVPNELGITLAKALESQRELRAAYETEPQTRQLLDIAMSIEGLPRHASTHAAGIVIAKEPLVEYVPLQSSTDDFVTTQYDKDRVEEIGLLKMDLLGLRTLTVIGDTINHVRRNRRCAIELDQLPLDDQKTYRMLAAGDTLGVFQMESAGITALIKELKPERLTDLIALVALYRPGPLGSGMVEDFIARRHGQTQVDYPHPWLEPILVDTFGVILYQEQVMQIASVLAGFSLSQADLLRRAMGKKQPDIIAGQRQNFVNGAIAQGVEANVAVEVFDLMAHFADYGFNKSHSAAYALIAYQTAYLKAHYFPEFMAALLSSVMGSSDKVGLYIEVCRRKGLAVSPPDINSSLAGFSVDGEAIRFGLAGVKNVGDAAIDNILAARQQGGKFKSLLDFFSRIDARLVNRRMVESLIKCGAFDSLAMRRSQLLSVLEQAADMAAKQQRDLASGQLGLFGESDGSVLELELPDLAELTEEQRLLFEKEMLGFYVTGHPLNKFRDRMLKFVTTAQLVSDIWQDGQIVKIGGIVIAAKRITTKNGSQMCFINLEDFVGQIEVVIFARLYERVNRRLVPDSAIVVRGRLSKNEDAIKVIAEEIELLESVPVPEVRIKLPQRLEQEVIFARLKAVFAEYPGDSSVYLYLSDSRRLIKAEDKYKVRPEPALIAALEAIVGKGGVVVH